MASIFIGVDIYWRRFFVNDFKFYLNNYFLFGAILLEKNRSVIVMLKQNLNDQCFSMANIFSFAEKVIPDFKNQSEGEKFLFLYCITAKLLSNRLYDNESAEDKINCLLSRIPKDKAKDAEQLKKSLETFVNENNFSVDKVKSFFDTNKDLLNKIYGNEKPADLLLFFVQMQSKKMFTDDNHKQFFKSINESIVQDGTIIANESSYCLAGKVIIKDKIENSLKSNPDRKFNEYIGEINQECKLNIDILEGDKYKTCGFKLEKRTYYKQWSVAKGKITQNPDKSNYRSNDEYISQTLDIDKILKEKFSFKCIGAMSKDEKDEFEKLGLSYDEEFIYFLAYHNLSNVKFVQIASSRYNTWFDCDIPNKISRQTTLKIHDYFVKSNDSQLIQLTSDYLPRKFETLKDLLDTYDKLKDSLSFKENELLNIFIGNPPKVEQVLKCQDTKSSEEINKLLGHCKFQDIIDYFVDVDDNKNQNLLSKYMLENPEKLCNDLEYINNKLNDLKKNKDKNDNRLKKLQNLMTTFFDLPTANQLLNMDIKNLEAICDYYLDNDEGKYVLLANMYSRVEKLTFIFKWICESWQELKKTNDRTKPQSDKMKKLEYLITKFLLSCNDKVFADDKKYIGYILDMFCIAGKFYIYDLDKKKEIDITKELQNLLNNLMDKLGVVENKKNLGIRGKDDEKKEDEPIIVELNGKSYDLTKIYFCPFENTSEEQYLKKNKHINNVYVQDWCEKIALQEKILSSKVVSPEKKQTVYFLANEYKLHLQNTYDNFCKTSERRFNDVIEKLFSDFSNKYNIDKITYNRLKDVDKNEIENRKTYLEKKANVTNFSYLKENWMTWLSFIFTFGITAAIYNFIWKPEYQNQINSLSSASRKLPVVHQFRDKENLLESGFVNNSYRFVDISCYEDNKTNIIECTSYKASIRGEIHIQMIKQIDTLLEKYKKDTDLQLQPEMEEINTTNIIA